VLYSDRAVFISQLHILSSKDHASFITPVRGCSEVADIAFNDDYTHTLVIYVRFVFDDKTELQPNGRVFFFLACCDRPPIRFTKT